MLRKGKAVLMKYVHSHTIHYVQICNKSTEETLVTSHFLELYAYNSPSSLYSWFISHFFGCLGSCGLSISEQILRMVFQLFVVKRKKKLKRYSSVRTKKLHKNSFYDFFFFLFWLKIGYHSPFNSVYNREGGFKNQPNIELRP